MIFGILRFAHFAHGDLMTVGGDKLELEIGIVTGWRGVEDADGKPVAFSTENLMKLLEAYPGLALHVMSYVTVEFSRLDGQTEKKHQAYHLRAHN